MALPPSASEIRLAVGLVPANPTIPILILRSPSRGNPRLRWPRDRRITRERHQLKNPSGRLLRELQQLDDEDPVLAAQAARLVGLYRRLWSSYVAKHADGHRLGKENRRLERSNHRLSEENRQMSRHYADQEAQLHHFQEAFRKVREAIIEIFARWKDVEPELAIFSQDRDAPHDKQSNPDSAGLR